ncbi:DUF2939 domain-containing protein [Sphingomonas koreensis]|uniref:DUF2939 domain-containing protein n=1 Tax=Sphingomonas koreensis TaxID=93064 RepID=UPI000F7ED76A|nr:DUF2939 domain-containing protein [Sphingomonas koreensis]MDC7808804.1 DUF2939 domain-containing protein [Sphingomonas koreensis]RSU98943.1 DUF2939 domain-containing protein [Sphingomonas koreensis]
MKKGIIGGVAAVLLALAAGWYFASPGMTLSAMRSAAEAGNADKLAEHIDFPALRVSMKEELKAKMAAEVAKQEDNPFAAIGAAIGMGMIDGMVDGLVTPASMRAVFSTKKEGVKGQITAIDGSKPDLSIQRDSFDQFTLLDRKEGGKGSELIFKRHGLGWKLSAIRFPAELAGPSPAEDEGDNATAAPGEVPSDDNASAD